jgi:hypothetical protein
MLNDTAKCYSTLEDDSPNRYVLSFWRAYCNQLSRQIRSLEFTDLSALIVCIHVKRYCVFDNTPRDQTVCIDTFIVEVPYWLFRSRLLSHYSVYLSTLPFKFLVLSCPDSRGEDLSQCECEIGIGFSEDAPNTPTCRFCSFCSDGTLNYNCDNLAGGTCIGRTCEGSCIVSLDYSAAVMRTTSILVSWITASLLLLDFF